jgi:hypothetical protein
MIDQIKTPQEIKLYYETAEPQEVAEFLAEYELTDLSQVSEDQWQEQADWYNATWSKEDDTNRNPDPADPVNRIDN